MRALCDQEMRVLGEAVAGFVDQRRMQLRAAGAAELSPGRRVVFEHDLRIADRLAAELAVRGVAMLP